MFLTESFLFHLDSAVNAAVHSIKNSLGTKELNEREILGKISSVRDITAKDNCSFVKNDLAYEVKAEDYETMSKGIVSRVATDSLADGIEAFDKFSKELLTNLLIYQPELAAELELTLPRIITSFEEVKNIILKSNIPVAPFKGRINSTSVRKYLYKQFPRLKEASQQQNNFERNYAKLIENFTVVRHAITHDSAQLAKTPKVDVPYLQTLIDIVDKGDYYIIHPTKVQADHVLDLIQEYAFLMTKQLSIELKLPWTQATYSAKPEMMLWEGRFPLFNQNTH